MKSRFAGGTCATQRARSVANGSPNERRTRVSATALGFLAKQVEVVLDLQRFLARSMQARVRGDHLLSVDHLDPVPVELDVQDVAHQARGNRVSVALASDSAVPVDRGGRDPAAGKRVGRQGQQMLPFPREHIADRPCLPAVAPFPPLETLLPQLFVRRIPRRRLGHRHQEVAPG